MYCCDVGALLHITITIRYLCAYFNLLLPHPVAFPSSIDVLFVSELSCQGHPGVVGIIYIFIPSLAASGALCEMRDILSWVGTDLFSS